ncbi:MAG TPA: carboxypeptidase-like regulatory domain-containing protein [Fulvivirga sp.]|nr:carboxypeptidase-like regulatory domain-containing protein [Fulvivirga sp.]
MKYLFLLQLTIAFLVSNGQSIILQGKVLNDSDSTPVAFCNIYINQGSIGTHSNESGEFILKVPENASNDSLTVSSIGYGNYSQRISDLDTKTNLIIKLKQYTMLLEEVTIIASKDTLAAIIKKAISKIPQNYPRKTFYLDGFYRELVLRDSTYVRLLEAAIGIQDKGFDRTVDQLRTRVLAIRKSEDFVNYSLYSKMHDLIYGERNNLYETFKFDKIRGYNVEGFRFLESLLVKPFDFELDTIQYLDDEEIYVINYQSINKGSLQEIGKIFINAVDNGIMRFEYQYKQVNKALVEGEPILTAYGTNIIKSAIVQYRKIEDKYYLNFIQWIAPFWKAWEASNEKDERALQFYNCSFYVNAVYTKKKDFDRIKNRDAQSKEIDLYGQEHDYDPDFWNDFNVVLINPLYKKAKSDLEKEKKLEGQFDEN